MYTVVGWKLEASLFRNQQDPQAAWKQIVKQPTHLLGSLAPGWLPEVEESIEEQYSSRRAQTCEDRRLFFFLKFKKDECFLLVFSSYFYSRISCFVFLDIMR